LLTPRRQPGFVCDTFCLAFLHMKFNYAYAQWAQAFSHISCTILVSRAKKRTRMITGEPFEESKISGNMGYHRDLRVKW